MATETKTPSKQMPAIPRRTRRSSVEATSANSLPSAPRSDTSNDNNVRMLHVEHLHPNPLQPRKTFEPEALEELAASITKHGMIQPVVVRSSSAPGETQRFEIVAGERRWRATQQLGLTHIECRVVQADDQFSATLALAENIHREDLSVLELATAYQTLIDEYGWTQQELAEQVASTRQQVGHVLSVLKLPESALTLVQSSRLNIGHIKVLLKLQAFEKALTEAAQRCVAEDMSVRALENYVSERLEELQGSPHETDSAVSSRTQRRKRGNPDWEASVTLVENKLDTQARIRGSKGNYILEVRFSDHEDLTRIIDLIGEKKPESEVAN